MGLFRDKSKKSWQRLSFGKKQTKAGILAKEESRSERVWRLFLAIAFALFATLVVGSCLPAHDIGQGYVPAADWVQWTSVFGVVAMVHLVMLLLVRAFHRHVFDSLPLYLLFLASFLIAARLMQLPAKDLSFLTPLPCFAIVIALVYGAALAIQQVHQYLGPDSQSRPVAAGEAAEAGRSSG